MTKESATQLVEEYLRGLQVARPYELVIVEAKTRDEDFGWVFFYNTRQFIETGDLRWALGGNAPLIVDRTSGELHVTGTAHPIDRYIEEYRARTKP